MIIVLQTVPAFRDGLRRKVQESAEKMFFTSSHREALDRVLAEKDKPGRTVVLSSAVFHGDHEDDHATKLLTGAILATGVKSVDETAWFFIYSTMPSVSDSVDGVIDKNSGDNMYDHAVEFLGLNFDEIESLEELRRRLPWLQ